MGAASWWSGGGTGMQRLQSRLHCGACALGSGHLGGHLKDPPSPGLRLTVPTGQGEPCEVCPTMAEGTLSVTGPPGKPGPRGAPGAPGKDGVSVSLNWGRGGGHMGRGAEQELGSASLMLPLHFALTRTDLALRDPKGTG